MSMLAAQAKKLRETADEVKRIKDNNVDWLWRDAITLDDAVKEMRDAADTIENLHNRLTETCHIDVRNGDWYCDGCGEMVGTCDNTSELFIDGNAIDLWKYCPFCGKRIVE